MLKKRFFDKHELSIGQCPQWRLEEFLYEGKPLPAFEPVEDVYARSHQMVEKLRNDIDSFDEIGGYEPREWEAVISNLHTLADLAIAAAEHMRRQLDEEAAEEARYQQWRNEYDQRSAA